MSKLKERLRTKIVRTCTYSSTYCTVLYGNGSDVTAENAFLSQEVCGGALVDCHACMYIMHVCVGGLQTDRPVCRQNFRIFEFLNFSNFEFSTFHHNVCTLYVHCMLPRCQLTTISFAASPNYRYMYMYGKPTDYPVKPYSKSSIQLVGRSPRVHRACPVDRYNVQ